MKYILKQKKKRIWSNWNKNKNRYRRIKKDKIEKFKPYNEQEEVEKNIILKYFDIFDDVLTRQNEIGHFTSSSFILNKERTKMLIIYHKIYNSWGWTGGHSDGDSDLLCCYERSKRRNRNKTC